MVAQAPLESAVSYCMTRRLSVASPVFSRALQPYAACPVKNPSFTLDIPRGSEYLKIRFLSEQQQILSCSHLMLQVFQVVDLYCILPGSRHGNL